LKHGVSFADAQGAFFNPRRVIAEDLEHSGAEPRYFCFGMVANGVMTVRFIEPTAFAFSARLLAKRKANL
jgi:uncharacterized DUF497 family protein